MASKTKTARKRTAPKPPAPPPSPPAEPSVPHGPVTPPRPGTGDGGPLQADNPSAPRRRIRLITNPPAPEFEGVAGHFAKPFAPRSQNGTYSPWATVQARRGR